MNFLSKLHTKSLRLATDNPDGKCTFRYLCADSRSVFSPADTIFAALSTGLGDGHSFVAELYSKGVRAFIVDHLSDEFESMDATFYVVDKVQAALESLAAACVANTDRGILVSGSYGKTIVKELLYTALLPLCDVRRSPRSWNSCIGVPLSQWEMTAEGMPERLITEVGIDGPGQAKAIVRTLGCSHRLGVLTPISNEHDDAFTSHREKIEEKARLFSNCTTLVYDSSDTEVGDVLASILPDTQLIAVEKGVFPSIYHALADAALAVLGYTAAQRAHVPSLPIACTRREITSGSYGATILRDNFTPDLLSLRMALDFMRRRSTANHPTTLILGNMLVPPHADEEEIYSEARRIAALFGIDNVICINRGDKFARQYMEHILLFGKNEGNLAAVAEELECAGHNTTLEVDLNAIVDNYNYYRSLVPKGTGIIAMVKASAYGTGAVEVGKTLQSHGAAYLAVAVIEEGMELRDAGITMPLVVLNPLTNRYPALFANRLEPTVFSPEELDRLISEAEACGMENYPIHIKLDTGMHRVGFQPEQLDGIVSRLATTNAVRVASVLSHLATADCLDMDEYTFGQIAVYREMTERLKSLLGYSFKRHILNTAGMMRFADALSYEMGRLGIGLYGVSPYPGEEAKRLRPVSALRTHIITLIRRPVGTPIGYGAKALTSRDAVIATIPVGYADGINRHLGRGRASFYVDGVACPTVGNICMDQCMIDVTDVAGAAVGTQVEIFGPQQPVEHLAEVLDTIPYEVLTSVSPRVKRVYTLR